jgi:hypothetical protein
MRKIAVILLAAVMSVAGVTVDAYADTSGRRDGSSESDRYNQNYGGYWRYGGGYRRNWRRHRNWYGPRYVVRRNYYGGGCMRKRYDAWGNVYFKVRRACRW